VKECRLLLATIAEKLFKALLILSSGESSLFQIGTLTTDTVFYKELFGEGQLYISNMKLNIVPENNM
jgi:hypothetical protein